MPSQRTWPAAGLRRAGRAKSSETGQFPVRWRRFLPAGEESTLAGGQVLGQLRAGGGGPMVPREWLGSATRRAALPELG